MSEKLDKGARVAIVSGRSGKGMRGEIFWVGDSRYGKGARYGVRGDDGETYWVDETQVGPEEAVPAPALPARDESAPLAKGTRVAITRGEAAGREGEVFWIGESRFGRGHRYGVRTDDGETLWVDGPGCEAIEGAPAGPSKGAGAPKDEGTEGPRRASAPSAREFQDDPRGFEDPPPGGFDDAPLPTDDDVAYGERDFEDDEEPPF